MSLFDDLRKVYAGKRVLVTGDTGFKGSWLCIWLKELGAEVWGYALPPRTRDDNFVQTGLALKIAHTDADIRDLETLKKVFSSAQPEFAFHLAAQPLVIDSYNDPRYTFDVNVLGTVNFFEAVRSCSTVKAAVNVTTDKCYHNSEWVYGYRETDPMGGKDPYSASKGCSELVTASYTSSFFNSENSAHVASARAGNVIGGGDWADNRIIPDLFRAYMHKKELAVRNPSFVRPWQFVLEPLYGYLLLAARLHEGGSKYSGGWNFGPSAYENYTVRDVVEEAKRTVTDLKTSYSQSASGVHEAGQLRLDISKAVNYLQWSPRLSFSETIKYTIDGYLVQMNGKSDLYMERCRQVQDFCQK